MPNTCCTWRHMILWCIVFLTVPLSANSQNVASVKVESVKIVLMEFEQESKIGQWRERGISGIVEFMPSGDATKKKRMNSNEKGELQDFILQCEFGDKFRGIPGTPALEPSLLADCRKDIKLAVRSRSSIAAFRQYAEQMEREHGKARALNEYNALAWYSSGIDLEVNAFASSRVYSITGEAFAIQKPSKFDPTQNKIVMTPELKEAIQTFQGVNGLTASGKLDSRTASTIGRIKLKF